MPSNAIVVENQKTGHPRSEWDITEASTTIEGFATRISVNHGTTVDFKINTNSANYRVDVYRLGYYAGNGARRVATIQVNTATVQPSPGGDAAIGLYDAGNWVVSASWAVPAAAVSGVYIAKLVRQDGVVGTNHIPFIVRDDGTQHDVVFQTSDTTWHAYNGWGGANLYGGNATASGTGRAFKVSYNRPITTREAGGTDAGPQDFVFSAEHAAIRWLERNGYDVSYISGVDTGPGNAQLTNYKVYLSVGHDEYWSGDQRAHVEAARDAGVNLIFISGNEVYWKTRWEPDINGTPNRTLVTYKETRSAAKIDPSPEWTGTWRDPSFSPSSDGGRPENALTGTIFQADSHRFDTIQVPYAMSRFRFWRNTAVAVIAPGTTKSLVQGTLGYEWDESPDNGFRPGGLIHLSSTTTDVDRYLVDYGLTTSYQEGTHNLSLYRAPSGALVFGAGTVFWSFGLDSDHDYGNSGAPTPVPVDPIVQQSTVNILADMGVQPATLQAGLTAATASTDVTAPTSAITAPLGGASVLQQDKVTITGTASDVGGLVAGVEVSTDDGTTWRAASGTNIWSYDWWPLLPGAYTIKSRAVDDSLNKETPGAGIAVTVTPSAAQSLFARSDGPATVRTDDPNPVELGVKFKANTAGTVTGVRFYKNPANDGTHVASLWSSSGTRLAFKAFAGETDSGWQTVTFTTPVALTAGSTYVASYSTNGLYSATPNYFRANRVSGALSAPASTTTPNGVFAYGAAGTFPNDSYNATNYWVDVVFQRAGGAGNLPPTAGNVGGFSTVQNTNLVIAASALIANAADPNGYPLTIQSVGGPVNGTVSYAAGPQTVTFVPTTGFTGLATFTYTVANGYGGTATGTVSVTVVPTTTTQNLFGTATPAGSMVTDVNPVVLGVKFKTSIAGQATGIRFYKGAGSAGTHVGHLWSSTGTALASATFVETASGWQTATFSTPVALTAGTTYVASYSTNGVYRASANYFSTARTSGSMVAPSSASSGGNGVFAYGPAGTFPNGTFGSTNYWVDAVIQTPAGFSSQSLLGNGTPTTVTVADGNPVTLGVKFQSSLPSQVMGVRFYKGATNTGTHTATLWSTSGVLLASAPFTAETASGWQSVLFTTPVTMTVGTTYIAAYHTGGYYSGDANYFAGDRVSGTLTAPSSASSGGNGLFIYGPAGSFPNDNYNATNYWVDPIVQTSNP